MKWRILFVVLYLILYQSCLFGITVNSMFKYSQSSDSTDVFNQNYTFVSSFTPTPRINVNSSVKYNKTKKGTDKFEMLTPTASISLNNDIFRLNMSGTITETVSRKKPERWSKNYDINFSTNYLNIAAVKTFYSFSSAKDDSHPKNLNTLSHSVGMTIRRTLYKILDISYDFKKYISNNKITDNKNIFTSESFFTNLHGISFRIKNLEFKFGSSFNYKRNIMKSKVLEGGYAKFPVNISTQWSLSTYEKKKLFIGEAIIVDLNEQNIDLIDLITDGIYGEHVSPTVKWDIYWNNNNDTDNETWSLIAKNVPLPYKFPQTFKKKGFIKLVVYDLPQKESELNEPLLECYILKFGTGAYAKYVTQNRDYKSDFSVNYRFNENIIANYRVNYNISNPLPGDKRKNIYQTSSLRVKHTSLTVSQNIKKTQNAPKTETLVFSISTYKDILKTLKLTSSFSRSISKENNKRTNLNDSAVLSVNATLYPDLTMRWSNSIYLSKSYSSGKRNKFFSSNIGLTARFTKKFTLTSTYKFDKNFGGNSPLNQNLSFNASWRVSDILFINGSENIHIPDKGTTEISNNATLWLALTSKVQVNLSYSGTRGKSRSDTFSTFASWRVSNKVSAKISYNQTVSKGERKWNSLISLNVSF